MRYELNRDSIKHVEAHETFVDCSSITGAFYVECKYDGPISIANPYEDLERIVLQPNPFIVREEFEVRDIVINAPQSKILILTDDWPKIHRISIKGGEVYIVHGGRERDFSIMSAYGGWFTECRDIEELMRTVMRADIIRVSLYRRLKDKLSWWINKRIFKHRYSSKH